ncbi:MAG TPA: BTAD domain-containing putative transcriptional regulator [Actinomycetota bacterium]|nr:BTAD domain-containing putative transcriptional regulator [Actinomycetota bacterium]
MGKPNVVRDGDPVPAPKGRKVWALLALLVLSEVPPTRERLAGLLFSEAGDPLGALRWNLAELRRLLGDPGVWRGEGAALRITPSTFVDVRAVMSGTWVEAIKLPGLGRDLLEGMNFPNSPALEAWLLNERRHLHACSANVLRESVVARVESGNAKTALADAAKLIEMNPLDESFQSLMIRAYVAAGDRDAALKQFESCRKLFQRELGVDPDPSVRAALDSPTREVRVSAIGGRAAARAMLDAGRAAIGAGAVETGLESLRRAASEAEDHGDPALEMEVLVALGTALVHSARGRGEEGAAVLHKAMATGSPTEHNLLAASAHREIGYVEMKRARYERAERWLSRALELSMDDPSEQAAALSVLGICRTDTGKYADAIDKLTSSLELAESIDDRRQIAYALCFLGRAHLLLGAVEAARTVLERALAVAVKEGWTALLPLPEALIAEVDFMQGHHAAAEERFEHAFALGCQLADPCWEGLGARGIGLIKARRGEVAAAVEWLDDARMRCTRLPDAYLWVRGYCLDALCAVGVEHGVGGTGRWIEDLESFGGRAGIHEFVVRAHLHRHQLGDGPALATARLLAAGIDNPALHDLLREPSEAR